LHYFGPWEDPDGALAKWLDQRDDLLAGRTPRVRGDGVTVRELANRFLTTKRHLLDTREITAGTFGDYYTAAERIVRHFGGGRLVDDLAANDFEALRASMAKTMGPVALGNEINRCRIVFRYAIDQGLTDKAIRYGQSFKRPSQRVLRRARAEKGPRMFAAADVRQLLKAAGPSMRAMIHLGVNCGLGNTDVATLPLSALDLKGGWLDFPRPKTGNARRVPLWPETVKALRAAIEARPAPRDEADAGLAFLTMFGRRWVRVEVRARADEQEAKGKLATSNTDSVALEFGKLLRAQDLHRPGLGFYTLRHVLETVGGESRDQVAVDAIMGHVADARDMSARYREGISDARLRAVVGHVRRWLFESKAK
jgi:integrase